MKRRTAYLHFIDDDLLEHFPRLFRVFYLLFGYLKLKRVYNTLCRRDAGIGQDQDISQLIIEVIVNDLGGGLSAFFWLENRFKSDTGQQNGARFFQGYGMSELSPVSHAIPAEGGMPVSSVGVLIPNCEAWLSVQAEA